MPFWVVLAAHGALGLGTLAGGWRIVKTMGTKLTKLRPIGGLCAETAGAVMLIGTRCAAFPSAPRTPSPGPSWASAPLSGWSAVRWGLAGRIVWAWILTIPLSALIAGLTWRLLPDG